MDWFLYDRHLRHERINTINPFLNNDLEDYLGLCQKILMEKKPLSIFEKMFDRFVNTPQNVVV